MATSKPTHLRLKTGEKVFVERFQGNIVVVKNMSGRVLGSYEPTDMPKFAKRYKSLVANKQKG